MKYNFDKLTDRRGVDSLKWDCAQGELPMWVADMDFENAPCIMDTVKARAERRTIAAHCLTSAPTLW